MTKGLGGHHGEKQGRKQQGMQEDIICEYKWDDFIVTKSL